jgi:hypothetical protein
MNNREMDAHQTLAIRQARKRSASISAAQTTRTDESLPSWVCASDDFAAPDAEGWVRMSHATNCGRKKGPGLTEAFDSGS